MSLLEIKNVNMNYHKKDGVTEALKNINFTVKNMQNDMYYDKVK